MTWYAASAVVATRLKDSPAELPLIEERIYLIDAPDDERALEKATKFANEEIIEDYTFEYEGREAKEEFLGIRKILTVRSHVFDANEPESEVRDGAELSFTFFRPEKAADISDFLKGSPVKLTYVD